MVPLLGECVLSASGADSRLLLVIVWTVPAAAAGDAPARVPVCGDGRPQPCAAAAAAI